MVVVSEWDWLLPLRCIPVNTRISASCHNIIITVYLIDYISHRVIVTRPCKVRVQYIEWYHFLVQVSYN